MEKEFLIEYGYHWRDRESTIVVCEEDKVENIAWAIYRGWLPNSPIKGCGFYKITGIKNDFGWIIVDCM